MKVETILFPSSYFDSKRVDEDLKNEYEVAIDTSLWNVILFDYDKWFNQGELVLSGNSIGKIAAVYRGWMMNAPTYSKFYDALLNIGIELITTPKEYEYFHYFPNVYESIKDDTPEIYVVPNGSPYNLNEIKNRFGRFMVKDYVKSVKGTEFPAYFSKNTPDQEFREAMKLFYKYRGDLFSGGLCFKKYVDLRKYGGKTNEYRVFYITNEVATLCRNSLQPEFTKKPPEQLVNKYKDLPSRFYTLDFAELEDGSWKILEAGDGSVSGPSDRQNLHAFYRALYQCLKNY